MKPQPKLKTQLTQQNTETFLKSITDENRQKDAFAICKLMSQLTKDEPKMWGPSIIGFGSRKLIYESGRELDWMKIGFSPRKANFVLYLSLGTLENSSELLSKLGKHKVGKGCLYINKLSDVDTQVLKELIQLSLKKKS